jgi:hypothetical protein
LTKPRPPQILPRPQVLLDLRAALQRQLVALQLCLSLRAVDKVLEILEAE